MSSEEYLEYIRDPFSAGPGIYTARAYALLATQEKMWGGLIGSPPPFTSSDKICVPSTIWTRTRTSTASARDACLAKVTLDTITSPPVDDDTTESDSNIPATLVMPELKSPIKLAPKESPILVSDSSPVTPRRQVAHRGTSTTPRRGSQITPRRRPVVPRQQKFPRVEIPTSRRGRESFVMPTLSRPSPTSPKPKGNYPDPRLFLKPVDPNLLSSDDYDDEL